jgi:hypothetical protein
LGGNGPIQYNKVNKGKFVIPDMVCHVGCHVRMSNVSADVMSDFLADVMSDIPTDVMSDVPADVMSDVMADVVSDAL